MLNAVLCFLIRAVLKLRYRVRVFGLDAVAAVGTRGILFLPNHPALIDPFIVLSTLFRCFKPRFLADRDQVNRPFVGWLAQHFGALSIPDAAKYGPDAKREIDAALDAGIDGLKRGENWLFYPAGRVYRAYVEDLGGNSAVEKILKAVPDARVVLLRTKGLWGSSFSWASGGAPLVGRVLKNGVLSLLVNGIFFSPRRHVKIELAEPEDLPRNADRFAINRYLEAFYNQHPLHNTYVPYTLWEGGGPRELPEAATGRRPGAPTALSEATRQAVIDKLCQMTGAKAVRDEDLLGRDLGLDSLSRVELSLWIQEKFGFPAADPHGLQSVGDLIDAASGQALGVEPATLKAVPARWFSAAALVPVEGGTVTEAFLAQARCAPGRAVLADQTSGVLTFRDVVTAILVLEPVMRAFPTDHVGIMLPASVAVNLVYLAVLFAGKTPVMVNWTVGARNMKHSLDILGVRKVVTAKALVKRLESQMAGLKEIGDSFVFLEDIATGVSLRKKIAAYLKGRIVSVSAPVARTTDTAVVLFTSGSESLPKAVPLTHANLLANLRDGMSALDFRADDRVMGLFPPFHSFGVTCNMMLPLAGGIRTAYYPNPTEGAALASVIRAYKCTIVFGTPTFLRGIVRAAREGELASLRIAVTGAEKCPQPVYEALAKTCPGMTVLEGYGVTECSPVISVNDVRAPRPYTVGKVVQSLEYAIVSVETGGRVERGASGMLLVRGPSVFPGYLNYQGESPFVQFEGKSWYRTGDIVSEDAYSVLTFRGRLKRFVKIGGEMISLPAIEAVLEKCFTRDAEGGPTIAVEAAGEEERPQLVLFTTEDADREMVNRLIREAGLSGLYNISRVVKLDEMPLLGTGKTDYRVLKAMLSTPGG